MGTLTIVISDDVEKKLREVVSRYGSGKGSLSRIVEDALRNHLSLLEKKPKRIFRAYKGDSLVSEAESLDELANMLKEKGIDARNVKIVSSELIKSEVRSGYRIR